MVKVYVDYVERMGEMSSGLLSRRRNVKTMELSTGIPSPPPKKQTQDSCFPLPFIRLCYSSSLKSGVRLAPIPAVHFCFPFSVTDPVSLPSPPHVFTPPIPCSHSPFPSHSRQISLHAALLSVMVFLFSFYPPL